MNIERVTCCFSATLLRCSINGIIDFTLGFDVRYEIRCNHTIFKRLRWKIVKYKRLIKDHRYLLKSALCYVSPSLESIWLNSISHSIFVGQSAA